MLFAQYCRIESKAGGIIATDRQFIKACHTFLSTHGKSQQMRLIRHKWIREGLHTHNSGPEND